MFLSIIIPIYNREDTIGRCLDSILDQRPEDIEIICVDDGSTDRTREVVQEYQQTNANIRMIENPQNQGRSYARNRGMEIAQGKYIWFVDSDDYISNDAISWLKSYCDGKEIDVVNFDIINISDRGRELGTRELERTDEIMEGKELFCLFSSVNAVKASVCSQIYLRYFLESIKLKFTEGYIAEGSAFNLKALILARTAIYIKKAIYIYLIGYSTVTETKKADYFKGWFMAFYNIWFFWKSQKWSWQVSENIARFLMTRYRYAKQYYYPEIREKVDKWAKCQEDSVYKCYLFFREETGGGYYVRELTSEQYTRIKSAENIYVFGAGTIARELAEILDRMEKRILAYLVSDYTSRNPESLYGVPVVKLSEIENKDKNACVIIATIPRYHNDIKTLLTEKGLTNILTIT